MLSACKKNFLDRQPDIAANSTPIEGSAVWKDVALAKGVLAGYYTLLPSHSFQGSGTHTITDEALSGSSGTGNNTFSSYGTGTNALSWSGTYQTIRRINLAIANLATVTGGNVTATDKKLFIAELRFMRADVYFDLVKRYGGVPIVTEVQEYDFSGDPSYLRLKRKTEAEVYDFIGTEVDAIAADLVPNNASKTRVNQYGALALKSRALLYAGSIAQLNSAITPTVATTGGEVGIPLSKAAGYYKASLEASEAIINSGRYSLYASNPADLGENFYDMYAKEGASNTEAIWARDYIVPGNGHNFTYDNIARAIREDNLASSATSPSLNLVEAFEYLPSSGVANPTVGTLKGVGDGTVQTNWIFYNTPSAIFAGKDARLYGTIGYPGTTMRGGDLDIQAGVYVWNSATNKYDRIEGGLGTNHTDGKRLTGNSGPLRNQQDISCTGFYLRKLIDPTIGTSNRGLGTGLWWIRFRLGEIYLNAAEAAFQLSVLGATGGSTVKAAEYLSIVRQRAGFGANSVTTPTFALIQNERRVELAFEDHRFWDTKRWRTAHTIWNGSRTTESANLYALFAYRVVRPGHPNDNKFVFDKFIAPRNTNARFWQLQNYYNPIDQSVIDNNPLITKNPFQ